MSLIVFRAKGKQVEACSDLGVYDEDGSHVLADVKVWHTDDARTGLVGCAGDMRWASVLRAVTWPALSPASSEGERLAACQEVEEDLLRVLHRRKLPPDASGSDYVALWGVAGRIFMLHGPSSCWEVSEPYVCVGAGASAAYGVLDAADLRGRRPALGTVVAVAGRHCTYVRGVGRVRVTR